MAILYYCVLGENRMARLVGAVFSMLLALAALLTRPSAGYAGQGRLRTVLDGRTPGVVDVCAGVD